MVKPVSPLLSRFRWPDGRIIIAVMAAVMFFFLTVPLLAMALRAVRDLSGIEALYGRAVGNAVSLSLFTTLISVSIVLIFGTPLAYVLARYHFRGKRVINVFVELPIILPPVVAGFGLLMAFGRRGLFGPTLQLIGVSLPFTTTAVILAQIFVAAPFFIRTVQVRFSAIPRDLVEAASIDGASTGEIFRHIVLPLSTPAMLAGLVLCWARALGEFGATILFAGSLQGRTQTMPLLVYGALERNLNDALWSALLQIGMALLALLLVHWIARQVEIDPLVEAEGE